MATKITSPLNTVSIASMKLCHGNLPFNNDHSPDSEPSVGAADSVMAPSRACGVGSIQRSLVTNAMKIKNGRVLVNSTFTSFWLVVTKRFCNTLVGWSGTRDYIHAFGARSLLSFRKKTLWQALSSTLAQLDWMYGTNIWGPREIHSTMTRMQKCIKLPIIEESLLPHRELSYFEARFSFKFRASMCLYPQQLFWMTEKKHFRSIETVIEWSRVTDW